MLGPCPCRQGIGLRHGSGKAGSLGTLDLICFRAWATFHITVLSIFFLLWFWAIRSGVYNVLNNFPNCCCTDNLPHSDVVYRNHLKPVQLQHFPWTDVPLLIHARQWSTVFGDPLFQSQIAKHPRPMNQTFESKTGKKSDAKINQKFHVVIS